MNELCRRTNQDDSVTLSSWYANWIDDSTTQETLNRDAMWTDSIAVGSQPFVESMGRRTEYRMKIDIVQQGTVWTAREDRVSYSTF